MNYEIKIFKTTSETWMKKAFNSTVRFESKVKARDAYKMEHSPIREQEFWIEMKNIPSFVSVHFVRHNVGVNHYVLSNRDDRGGSNKEDRWTPVNHNMKINAEALINLARKRLCLKSHKETVNIMNIIKQEIKKVDRDLYDFLAPNCVYRNGLCKEGKSTCGNLKRMMKEYSYYKGLFI